jgi:hypothetical protein
MAMADTMRATDSRRGSPLPNRARTASPRPSPVTTPRRADISCSTSVAAMEKVRAQSSA